MSVSCTQCGRQAWVSDDVREVACECGQRFDPATRPTVPDPFVGQEVAGYRFDSVLGSGGMGTVYKATQQSLNRAVAIKVLPAHVAEEPQFVQRFHREAQVLASLSHPNIVQVFDRGEHDGRFFIVMEFIDGETLRALMRRGPVPAKQAYKIMAALLHALDFAHERGVIHRDIKPENILITPDGAVKVADFGLSRVLGEEEFETRLTRTHLVLGTYEYMAPEQREASKEADPRADIYAAAVVLYEALTGELPIGRFRAPCDMLPHLDQRLDKIVDRGLAKDPDQRYARASRMGAELEALMTTPDGPVDMEAIKDASKRALEAGKVALEKSREAIHRSHRVFRRMRHNRARHRQEKHAPTRYELKLDLLLTILSVCGIALSIVGFGLLVSHEEFDIGGYDIDRDGAGVIVMVFGILMWRAAEKARKYWPGARTMLLTLTLLLAPTVVGIPLAVYAWVTLMRSGMRSYYTARFRGMEADEAAAVAGGFMKPPEASERWLRGLTRVSALAAVAFTITWVAIFSESPQNMWRDEGLGFFVAAVAAIGCFVLFRELRKKL